MSSPARKRGASRDEKQSIILHYSLLLRSLKILALLTWEINGTPFTELPQDSPLQAKAREGANSLGL